MIFLYNVYPCFSRSRSKFLGKNFSSHSYRGLIYASYSGDGRRCSSNGKFFLSIKVTFYQAYYKVLYLKGK